MKLGSLRTYPVIWTDVVGVDLSDDDMLATKQDAGNSWNAGVCSRQALNGDGTLDYVISGDYLFVGLSTENDGVHYTSVDFGLYAYPGTNRIMLYEFGSYQGISKLGYSIGDALRLKLEGTELTAWCNHEYIGTYPSPVSTPLLVDVSLYLPGIELRATLTSSTPLIDPYNP